MAWFETRGLDYRYRQGPLVVRGVSFGLERGRLMAVIGANGSGKSTLLRMMAGLLRPVAGEMRLDGRALAAMTNITVAGMAKPGWNDRTRLEQSIPFEN